MCDETKGGALQWDQDKIELTFCDGIGEWRSLFTAGPGDTESLAAKDCKAILDAGQRNSGLYWIKPGAADAVRVYCQMTIDGGGWTTCASRNFNLEGNGDHGFYLGNTELSSVFGTAQVPSMTSTGWGANCGYLMEESSKDTGNTVEFLMFNAEAPADWMSVYPWDAQYFHRGLTSHADFVENNCGGPKLTECRGSATEGTKSIDLSSGCHWNGGHRTGDNYFIYQVSSSQNTNALMEIGQGDPNHPVAFRSDCGNDGYWSSCSPKGPPDPALSRDEWNVLRASSSQTLFAYQSHPQCSRMGGPVMLGFRAKVNPLPVGCAEILASGTATHNGVYTIDPGTGGPLEVYCDLDTFGGGWTYAGRNGSPDPRTNDEYYTGSSLSTHSKDPYTNHGSWHLSTSAIMAIVGGSGSVYEVYIQDYQSGTSCQKLIVMKFGPVDILQTNIVPDRTPQLRARILIPAECSAVS